MWTEKCILIVGERDIKLKKIVEVAKAQIIYHVLCHLLKNEVFDFWPIKYKSGMRHRSVKFQYFVIFIMDPCHISQI
jgi:hypothetical protein